MLNFRHFQETQHTYAMQLGNNRVWDYVGDNFVHRLVQSKGDGKLVAVEDQQSSEMDGKVDALSLEVRVVSTCVIYRPFLKGLVTKPPTFENLMLVVLRPDISWISNVSYIALGMYYTCNFLS